MSAEKVKEFFKIVGRDSDVLEFAESTATVQLAANALGTIPAKIAKTIALKSLEEDKYIILVTAGDSKLDNKKFRDAFGVKPKMLSPEKTLEVTGYAVGGVCPFGLPQKDSISLALDVSLKRFTTVFPACGSSNSAIELTIDELMMFSRTANWVDACKDWDPSLG